MNPTYPSPNEVGIPVPAYLMRDRFCKGFRHALQGKQINHVAHLKLSFREGFRAGKLYLRELRRSQGIIDFPVKYKMRIRTRSAS